MIYIIREWFSSWNSSRKSKQKFQEEDEVASRFQVKEMSGELYLTCDGIPYQHLPPSITAKEITERLTDARLSAFRYRKLSRSPFIYLRTPVKDSSEGSSRLDCI